MHNGDRAVTWVDNNGTNVPHVADNQRVQNYFKTVLTSFLFDAALIAATIAFNKPL
jgi:hypothetical protein